MKESFNPSQAELEASLHTLLEGDFWIRDLSPDETYARLQDDTDGDRSAKNQLQVHVASDGDLHVFLPYSNESLRFRSYFGGGASPRVRNALIVLAEAIRRDNEDCPQ